MKELEELRSFKQKVEESLQKGGFSFWDTRILHLRENPYSELKEKKEDALKQQLETLRSKIQPFSPVSVTSPRADSSVAPLNDSTCKEEIETLKKRIERMKEVFAAQTKPISRCSVAFAWHFHCRYQLTGWNIDLSLHENRLRLKSRYASKREDTIELMW